MLIIFFIKSFESNKQKQIIKWFPKMLVYFKQLNFLTFKLYMHSLDS